MEDLSVSQTKAQYAITDLYMFIVCIIMYMIKIILLSWLDQAKTRPNPNQ